MLSSSVYLHQKAASSPNHNRADLKNVSISVRRGKAQKCLETQSLLESRSKLLPDLSDYALPVTFQR